MIKIEGKEFHGRRKNTGEENLSFLDIQVTLPGFLCSKLLLCFLRLPMICFSFLVFIRRRFLLGLLKYGKGDWRNISRNFVGSKTPTQVASHAQKYYQRQLSGAKDKRRPSIHDITTVNLLNTNITRPSSDHDRFLQQPDESKLGFTDKGNAEEGVMFLGQNLSSVLSPYEPAFKFTGTNVYGGGAYGLARS